MKKVRNYRGLKFFSFRPCNGHEIELLYPFSDMVEFEVRDCANLAFCSLFN